MSARRKQPESQLQQWCVKWFRYQFPQHIIFAIPNGGVRNISTAVRLKKEGVVSGVADLFLPVANIVQKEMFHGLFIEMKFGKGKQTEHQIAFQKAVTGQGFKYIVCSSFDDFKIAVENYLK